MLRGQGPDIVGTVWDGEYYITRALGKGGFGRVYHATRTSDGIEVAVKILTNQTDDSLKRFVREARQLAKQADNPHIVDFISANMDSQPPYLVMEYCEGGSLRSWVGKAQDWKRVATALLHCSDGLLSIHAAKGFHRDIKPDNMLLKTSAGEKLVIKLADLGLARVPEGASSSMTFTVKGTYPYIAPEVFSQRTYSQPADIYSLGITGVELLTGRREAEAIKEIKGPDSLVKLLSEMISQYSTERPSILAVKAKLAEILKSGGVPEKATKQNDPFLWLLAGGVAAVLGLVLLAEVDEPDIGGIR